MVKANLSEVSEYGEPIVEIDGLAGSDHLFEDRAKLPKPCKFVSPRFRIGLIVHHDSDSILTNWMRAAALYLNQFRARSEIANHNYLAMNPARQMAGSHDVLSRCLSSTLRESGQVKEDHKLPVVHCIPRILTVADSAAYLILETLQEYRSAEFQELLDICHDQKEADFLLFLRRKALEL